MIEAYVTNAAMRAQYLRINGISHAEVWDTDTGYQVALCSAEMQGFPESPEFRTPGQCAAWCGKYAPELTLKG